MEYWKAKPHAQQKYNILSKYLAACGKFARKYRNFAYIDTHGGSGLIEVEEKRKKKTPLFTTSNRQMEGSPLIAAHAIQAWAEGKEFPCYIIEIHPGRYVTLQESTAAFPWVHTHQGDCNVLLPQILEGIPQWAFILCFIDPDGLVCRDLGSQHPVLEFTWETMQQIASRKKVEILLNFPVGGIIRVAKHCQKYPEKPASWAMASHLTTYFGCDDWWGLRGKRQFLDLYLHRLRSLGFPFLGAYYVCRGNLALYYLIYSTRYINRKGEPLGAKIMRNVMQIEWKKVHPRWADEAALANVEYPIEEFVLDDERRFVSRYPLNWEEIARAVKEAAGWRCQECGHPQDPKNQYVLIVHHQDGNPANNELSNLVALCQRCLFHRHEQQMPADRLQQIPLFL